MNQVLKEEIIMLACIIIPLIIVFAWCAWPVKQEYRKDGVVPGSSLWDDEEDSGVHRRGGK